MLELATIVREVGDDYRRRFGDRMLPSHRRALRDIEHCRTAVLGGQLYRCDGCAREQYGYHSCQNRACPKCQADRTAAWLQAQAQRLLACDHYLFTFTLPAPLRPVARSHQRAVYDALLRCAADAVLTLAADPRHLGARPAILAVLHTHGRAWAITRMRTCSSAPAASLQMQIASCTPSIEGSFCRRACCLACFARRCAMRSSTPSSSPGCPTRSGTSPGSCTRSTPAAAGRC